MTTRYTARYDFEVVTRNKTILAGDFSAISFKNIGEGTGTINDIYPVTTDDISIEFSEKPNVEIQTDFKIQFDSNTANNKVIVVKTFYKEK